MIFFFCSMNGISALMGSTFTAFDNDIDCILLIYPLQEAEGVGHELPCSVRTCNVFYKLFSAILVSVISLLCGFLAFFFNKALLKILALIFSDLHKDISEPKKKIAHSEKHLVLGFCLYSAFLLLCFFPLKLFILFISL